jgi:hypothetical protein
MQVWNFCGQVWNFCAQQVFSEIIGSFGAKLQWFTAQSL